MADIKQPTEALQMALDAILSETPTEIEFNGRTRKIGWMRNETIRRFSHVMVSENNIQKRNVKLCAIVLLNNLWLLRFWYWIYWRWLYYIMDLDEVEILKVLDCAKKKIPSEASSLTTILAIGMTDLMMTMTNKEVRKATQAAQRGAQGIV